MFNQQHREGHGSNPGILITKDLLGGLSCNPQESAANLDFKPAKPLISGFQDLNHPPEMIEKSLESKLESIEKSLELKLESSCTSSDYQSVCTLEKVKNALRREEKKRSSSPGAGMMFAAGCPGCLLYVITLKTNPKCPRCNSTVSSSLLKKKPKLDLNASSI